MDSSPTAAPPSPFIVFALPRSRTAWLSQWLAYGGRQVGHDLGIEADTCQGFLGALCARAGSIETGAMVAHRLLREALPAAKFVTIRRPMADVLASLARLGIGTAGQEEEMARRCVLLDEIEAAGALRVDYEQLNDVCACADLWEHLLGIPFDFRWWRQAQAVNVQIDFVTRIVRLTERANAIAKLKAEAATMPTLVAIQWEPVEIALPDCLPMGARQFREVNAGERLGHPFRPNEALMIEMGRAGYLRWLTARIRGKAAGYITWTITPDSESEGVILADQGAWYVDPAPELRHLHIGRRLMDRSMNDLRAAGIHSLQLHHQMNGRGERLGMLFKRLGAVEHQHRYTLWLGSDAHG